MKLPSFVLISSLDALHHLSEFLEVNLPISILVNLFDCRFQLLLRVQVLELLPSKHLLYFRAVDLS